MNITEPLTVPKSENLYQVYAAQVLPIASPYQISSFADPMTDDYVSEIVSPFHDYNSLDNRNIIEYTYLYNITGYSVLYPRNRATASTSQSLTGVSVPGNPVFPNEFEIVCCSSNSSCVSDDYPRVIVSTKADLLYEVKVQKTETDTCVYYLDYRGSSRKLWIYINDKANTLISDFTKRTQFQANLFAYLALINGTESFLPVDVFVRNSDAQIDMSTQLVYPYMIYANLLLIDGYYATSSEWATMWSLAIDFVNLYAKVLWTRLSDTYFEYSYIQPLYCSLYKQYMIKNSTQYSNERKLLS